MNLARLAIVIATALALSTPNAVAKSKGGGHSGHSSGSHGHVGHSASHHASEAGGPENRTSTSHKKRDPAQRAAFQKTHPCPSTGKSSGACPGYVVDHVTPLKRGGADRPYNMQWQTKAEAREKDKWE